MTIGFDVSDLAANRADGTTRYTRELAKRLPSLSGQTTWNFYSPGEFEIGQPLPANVKKVISPWPKYWTQLKLPFDLQRDKPEVLFMPIQQLPILRPRKMKTVAVIHDLAFHIYPEQFTYKDWLLLHTFTAQVAREADRIIAVSQATADDIATYYGRTDEVHVVHHGVDQVKFHKPTEEERQIAWRQLTVKYPDLKKPYILYVGQMQPRKNLVRLIKAFEILHEKEPDLQLVISSGHGWKQAEILTAIKQSKAAESILMLGSVPDELLPALYWQAAVFTLVSLYEGFGMPILEALACGTPVVTSDVSSMPEVGGNQVTLVDPLNIEAIVEGVRKGRSMNLPVANHLAAFSWDRAAKETLDILLK